MDHFRVTQALLEDVKAWLAETFPERQVYIRSEGRVQFFTFSPAMQAVLASATLVFLGWVAFATVNVVFKDRIIAAKETHFRQMQTAYENRVANLQLSYDEVNTALVAAEDKFGAKAGELEAKQNTILVFLGRKRAVDSALAAAGRPVNVPANAPAPKATIREPRADIAAPAAKPAAGRTRHTSFLQFGGAVGRWAGALFRGSRRTDPQTAALRHPALAKLSVQTARVDRLDVGETVLMRQADGEAAKGVQEIRTLLRRAGIEPDAFVARAAGRRGQGGPEIPLDPSRVDGVRDPAFQQAFVDATATLNQLDRLLFGLARVPLTIPVAGEQFDYSSGFGARVDPITGHYAFHPGIDFSGPYGSIVRATAPGVVVGAKYDGAYGNIVEINHGNGIRTRYGHLSAFLVRPGMRVEKGAPIGRLGSTGRSTGPHVHYEVWYDGTLRNPKNFIEAGRYVLKQG